VQERLMFWSIQKEYHVGINSNVDDQQEHQMHHHKEKIAGLADIFVRQICVPNSEERSIRKETTVHPRSHSFLTPFAKQYNIHVNASATRS
jgi:hypothetical protein